MIELGCSFTLTNPTILSYLVASIPIKSLDALGYCKAFPDSFESAVSTQKRQVLDRNFPMENTPVHHLKNRPAPFGAFCIEGISLFAQPDSCIDIKLYLAVPFLAESDPKIILDVQDRNHVPDVFFRTSKHDISSKQAVNSEAQIVTRPDAGDILGCFKTCSSSPLTKTLRTYTGQAQSTDELSEGNLKSLSERRDLIEWVVSTKDARSALPPSLSIPSPRSISCSLKTIPGDFVTGESLTKTRALIMGLFQTLSHYDSESSFDELSLVEEGPVQSTYSSPPPTNESGTNTSPKSGTSASDSGFERGSKRSHPTRAGSSHAGDGDEPSRKESRQEKNPSNPETTTSFQWRIQMPCPVHQPQKCQGTNAPISELLRSLEVRHRVVICKGCCIQFHVPEEERKPENVRKRHKSEACEPRCIDITCSGIPSDEMPHYRRTENCPTWQSLPGETR
ncbi:hypothetical protein DER46DRAFT_568899 [Fusarium sp. MPI-SDFR-AT-0072]|nr:hypothetical protein DER46DRAFT_568899 [Fusarium sp. MPI-SDFR-AT-0072]